MSTLYLILLFYNETLIPCFLQSSAEMRVVSEANRSVLLVREIGPQHAGEFTCRAENVAGSVTCTATLALVDVEWEEATELLSPYFIQPVTPQKVMDGQRVLFTCQV